MDPNYWSPPQFPQQSASYQHNLNIPPSSSSVAQLAAAAVPLSPVLHGSLTLDRAAAIPAQSPQYGFSLPLTFPSPTYIHQPGVQQHGPLQNLITDKPALRYGEVMPLQPTEAPSSQPLAQPHLRAFSSATSVPMSTAAPFNASQSPMDLSSVSKVEKMLSFELPNKNQPNYSMLSFSDLANVTFGQQKVGEEVGGAPFRKQEPPPVHNPVPQLQNPSHVSFANQHQQQQRAVDPPHQHAIPSHLQYEQRGVSQHHSAHSSLQQQHQQQQAARAVPSPVPQHMAVLHQQQRAQSPHHHPAVSLHQQQRVPSPHQHQQRSVPHPPHHQTYRDPSPHPPHGAPSSYQQQQQHAPSPIPQQNIHTSNPHRNSSPHFHLQQKQQNHNVPTYQQQNILHSQEALPYLQQQLSNVSSHHQQQHQQQFPPLSPYPPGSHLSNPGPSSPYQDPRPVSHHTTPAPLDPHIPVQAPADSTTKPKKPRSRKKKSSGQNSVSVNSMAPQTVSIQSSQNLLQHNTDIKPPITFQNSQALMDSDCVSSTAQADFLDFDFLNADQPLQQSFMEQLTADDMGMGEGSASQEDVITMVTKMNTTSQGNTDMNAIAMETKPTIVPDLDLLDEFGHLSDNVLVESSPMKQGAAATDGTPQKPSVKPSPFQNSFLSFLQGETPETLSSVTNSPVTKKPQLPKYIPEPPRPKPPPRRPPPPAVHNFSIENSMEDCTGSDSNDCPVVAPVKRKRQEKVRKEIVVPAQDESNDGQKDEIEPEPKVPPLKISLVKLSPTKKNVEKKRKQPVPDLAPRERVSRRAKDKTEQMKREKEQKKSTRKKMYSDDDFSDPDDFAALSSCNESEKDYDSDKDPVWDPTMDTKPSKSAPTVFIHHNSDSDGDGPASKRRKLFNRKPRTSTHEIKPAVVSSQAGPFVRTNVQSVGPSRPVQPTSADHFNRPPPNLCTFLDYEEKVNVHNYQRGEFLLSKQDLNKVVNYSIWKLEAGRLLQKYEYVDLSGKIIHKSIPTYTSWTEGVKKNYKPIKVRALSNTKGIETVKVLPEYEPVPFDEKLEENPLLQAFNVYIQIMLSQALEPGFLSTVTQQDDDYLTPPLRKIEQQVLDKRAKMKESLTWKTEFKKNVDSQPYLMIIDQTRTAQPCQVCPEGSHHEEYKALQSVRLLGEEYNADTLDGTHQLDIAVHNFKEYYVCDVVLKTVRTYHKLQHFRHSLHRECFVKVMGLKSGGLEQSEVLDQCLQNRGWVQQCFTCFKTLLEFKMPRPLTTTTSVPS